MIYKLWRATSLGYTQSQALHMAFKNIKKYRGCFYELYYTVYAISRCEALNPMRNACYDAIILLIHHFFTNSVSIWMQ